MRTPKPIKLLGTLHNGSYNQLEIVGYKSKKHSPYIIFTKAGSEQLGGYLQDRDLTRLAKWCKDCLKKRK